MAAMRLCLDNWVWGDDFELFLDNSEWLSCCVGMFGQYGFEDCKGQYGL